VDTTAAFVKCKLAYEVLSDAQCRSSYDQHLKSVASYDTTEFTHVQPQHASAAAAAATAGATAAAAVNSSGLSASGHTRHHSTRTAVHQQHAGMLYQSHTLSNSSSSILAKTRTLLLEQHNIALEQFSTLQEALQFLQQLDEQCSLLGLASDDYTFTAMETNTTSSSSGSSGSDSRKQCRWGHWHPGPFTPDVRS
jgi:curved DNA-binding protein CbpA